MILGERWAITPEVIREIQSASTPFRKICTKITEWVCFIENTGFAEIDKIKQPVQACTGCFKNLSIEISWYIQDSEPF